jgi:hypothetical protein
MLMSQHPITFLWRVYVKPFPASLLWISDRAEQGYGHGRDIQNTGLVLHFSSVRKSLHSIILKGGRIALTSQPDRRSEEGIVHPKVKGRWLTFFFFR